MAVAVKNTPELGAARPPARLPIVCLAGVAYVLGSLGIVCGLIPTLWWWGWEAMNLGPSPFVGPTLLALVMLAAFTGLVILGSRLLGPRAPAGARAGIFVGLVGLVVIWLIATWIGWGIESWVYDGNGLGGNRSAGVALTIAIGVVLFGLGVWAFLRPGGEQGLVRFEEQGWFHALAYKPGQGLRVRRGTMLGMLLLVAAGIWTLMAHKSLTRQVPDWRVPIPFTDRVVIAEAKDVPAPLRDRLPAPGDDGRIVVDRYQLIQAEHAEEYPGGWVKVTNPGSSDLKEGQLLPKTEFDEKKTKLKEEFPDALMPEGKTPLATVGTTNAASITLLPGVAYTVPLLLLALGLWLSWRVVNLPIFADFLIATEAELNKVSWTTRRRLFQDTVVVLVTVALMASYLFLMDQAWRLILSSRPIGVIQYPEKTETNLAPEQKRY